MFSFQRLVMLCIAGRFFHLHAAYSAYTKRPETKSRRTGFMAQCGGFTSYSLARCIFFHLKDALSASD